jgi:hypothetical protein
VLEIQVGKKWLGDLSSMGWKDFSQKSIRAKSESFDGEWFEAKSTQLFFCR